MKIHCRKKVKISIALLRRPLALRGASLLIPALMLSAFAVTRVQATTVVDPDPEPSTTQFGESVIAIGDVDADGVVDLAVGAPFQDGDFVSTDAGFGKPQNVGKVYVISGATQAVINEMDDPEFGLIQPQHFGGLLGNSLAALRDINGDGITDVVAGVPHHIENPSTFDKVINGGEAFVFSGKDGTLLLTLKDPTVEEDGKMGTSVAALGDVNSDGVADIVVGVPGKDIGGEDGLSNVGIAYVFSGKDGSVIGTLNHPDQGGAEAGAAFGTAVANAGDVNHDRISDIAVGAPGEGQVFVFSGKTQGLLYTIVSPLVEKLHSFGAVLAGGKDFNKDRVSDLVISAPLQKDSQGAVYIFNGTDGSLQRRLRNPTSQTFSEFGASLATTDDITGDGRPDIIVGSPDQTVNNLVQAGEAFVFNGANGRLFKSLTSASPQAYAGFGSAVTAADFNSDGISTAVVGVPDQDANVDSVAHLQLGQIEFQQ
jgi:hypothetical protein